MHLRREDERLYRQGELIVGRAFSLNAMAWLLFTCAGGMGP